LAIIKDLIRDGDPVKDSRIFLYPSLLFVITNGLLYNIYPDSFQLLYILYIIVKIVLNFIYDTKYHFNGDKIIYNLYGILMANKIY
jgi:hypothetical protein